MFVQFGAPIEAGSDVEVIDNKHSSCDGNQRSLILPHRNLPSSSHLLDLSRTERIEIVNQQAITRLLNPVFIYCIETGWQKQPAENVFEYLMRCGGKEDLNWIRNNSQKLKTKHDSYDITFLYDLINRACPKIVKYDANKCDDNSLEASLQKAKEMRNSVFHEPKSTAISPSTFSEIVKYSLEIVERCNERFKLSQPVKESKLTWVRELIREVEETVQTTETKKIAHINYVLKTKGKNEQFLKWNDSLSQEFLHFSNMSVSLSDIYYYTKILDDLNQEEIEVDDIIRFRLDKNIRFAFICGNSGAGKSCLIRKLALDFIDEKSEPKFFSVREYENVILIACRDTQCSSFREYLIKSYSETAAEFDVDDVMKAIEQMKLLVLIDGIDEMNSSSYALVNDVIEHLKWKTTAKFVITSRFASDLELRRNLKKDNINFQVFTIQPINELEEQIEFIQKYFDAMPTHISDFNFVDTYRKQRSSGSSHFNIPLHLAMLCYLFLDNPAGISGITHEGCIMREMLKLFKFKITERIKPEIYANADILASKVISFVSETSLWCHSRGILQIDENIFNKLEEKCFNVNSKIPVRSCLSCMLREVKSFYDSQHIQYIYLHKSHQEYLSARIIVAQLEQKRNGTFVEILAHIVNDVISSSDLIK